MTADPRRRWRPTTASASRSTACTAAGYRTVPLVDDQHRPIGVVTVNDVVGWLARVFPEAILNLRPGDRVNRPAQMDSG